MIEHSAGSSRQLGSGLEDHLDFAQWVRSLGGQMDIHSGELRISGPEGEVVTVQEGHRIVWDGKRFSAPADREGRHGELV